MTEPTTQQVPDITAFCAEEDGRYIISKPWVDDGWRYATDGRLVVRVPTPDEDDTPTPPQAERQLVNASAWFADLYPVEPAHCTEPFPKHDGRTFTQACDNEAHEKKCPACIGSGTCHCPSCDNAHDCPKCDGRGYRKVEQTRCPECNSFGYRDDPAPQVIAGKRIRGASVILIAGLPGARYYSDGHAGRPLHFVADGGLQGVVSIICTTEERETGKLEEATRGRRSER